jgi:hypothetical protein
MNATVPPARVAKQASSWRIDCNVQRTMTAPVLQAETGMTYERAAIRKWFFMGGDTCPLTGIRLTTTKVR